MKYLHLSSVFRIHIFLRMTQTRLARCRSLHHSHFINTPAAHPPGLVAAQASRTRQGEPASGVAWQGPGLYHRYNAALKRACNNKSRAEMTLAEPDAAIGWLERNRLSEHLHLLDDDPR